MSHEVKYELLHAIADADGNILMQPGVRFDSMDAKELKDLPRSAYKPVIVDTSIDVNENPFPEHNTPEQPQRVTQPGPRGDGDQIVDPKGQAAGTPEGPPATNAGDGTSLANPERQPVTYTPAPAGSTQPKKAASSGSSQKESSSGSSGSQKASSSGSSRSTQESSPKSSG
jgi:hypothetical protein